jgi:2-aminoadipate transaminase
MLRALDEEMPAEASWTRPAGGLFVWATLPDYLDSSDLLASAVERYEVAFVPGRAAFLDGRGGNAMRLNFSGVPEAMIGEGVRRLGVAVAEMTELHRALGGLG